MTALKCFTIMPFAREFDDVYETIRRAVEEVMGDDQLECHRLDEIKTPGAISADLANALETAAICVGDATGLNSNVMWEIGYSMALRKPLILITQDTGPLPFDLRDYRTLTYERSALSSTLLRPLKDAIGATLKKFAVRGLINFADIRGSKTIAVTGSMHCDPSRAARRVEQLLSPHLGQQVQWLVGCYGVVDEAAIRFLASHKETLTLLAYHSMDLSEGARQLMESYQLPFVDSSSEQLPELASGAPTRRDALFYAKADLAVFFWDGASRGTQELIHWFSKTHRDHVVGFV